MVESATYIRNKVTCINYQVIVPQHLHDIYYNGDTVISL